MEGTSDLASVNIDLNNFPYCPLDGNGVRTAYGDTLSVHPMHDIDCKNLLKEEMAKFERLQKTLGYQAALKNSIELNTCSKSTRLPGMKSSMLSVEILMDKLDSLESYEYLNVEKPRHEFGIGGLHSLLETKFNV
ncbi:proteasome maturation factor ump1 [Babesia ovata]|uniref:Proteasome maturation factor ump1 n=1 Tax=Babesia ovata TaxID=189622 RepID=A0A2H6K7R7_9APIC|nr:proteasome maturation factor ump1 [Babesia ovata]GBE59018.1 proteasome maturation factor ump1 [Babesia ovata]